MHTLAGDHIMEIQCAHSACYTYQSGTHANTQLLTPTYDYRVIAVSAVQFTCSYIQMSYNIHTPMAGTNAYAHAWYIVQTVQMQALILISLVVLHSDAVTFCSLAAKY